MESKDLEFETTLDESKTLLDGAARVADEEYEFTLESILAEFGGDAAKPAEEDAAPPEPAVSVPTTLPELTGGEEENEEEEDDEGAMADIVPEVDTPQSVSLQEILSQTVQEVLDEQKHEPVLEEPPRRRGLFSRKKVSETDELYDSSSVGGERISAASREKPQPEPEETPAKPEPPIEETVADYRAAAQNARGMTRVSLLISALMWLPQLLDRFSLMPEIYASEPLLNVLPYFVLLALVCVMGREVILYAVEKLASLKLTYELLTTLLCLAALVDTALFFLHPARAQLAAAPPLHSIAALAMTCALWGRSMLFRSLYDSFRIAALGDAPYLITLTAGGAAKRTGSTTGFSTTAEREDVSGRAQAVVLPVILVGAIVLSILATVEGKNGAIYFRNLSAILAGATTLSFPLVYSLPLRKITRRLTKSGSALAGYSGADQIRRSNCLILTDTDLFPPGTVTLSGLKIFGEESGKVFSYAATMAHASETGIARLFDNLLAAEGGKLEPLSDLNYYEEGGVGGTIHGETVLFGTSSFCRRMGITLPQGMKLKTGMFLAVDGSLIAVFAVKYMASENVDWALHALHRAHITPVLAVRDGNITPALLKRMFGTDARAVYPRLSTRLALSEKAGSKPCALIYRDGLMPYAELAVGSKRLCRAISAGNVISLASSVAGTLLTYYFSFIANYTLFTPWKLVLFLLLWAIASLVHALFVDKY